MKAETSGNERSLDKGETQIYPTAGDPEPIPAPVKAAEARTLTFDHTRAARALWSAGWASWWVQLVLSTISAVIFLFAFAFPGVTFKSSSNVGGLVLAAAGVVVSFLSLIWTYGYTRLSLWLERNLAAGEKGALKVEGRLRMGVLISLFGIFLSILGLQAIVGTLLARLFSSGFVAPVYVQTPQQVGVPSPTVQPVDILVVQATANAITALFAATIASLWLKARSRKWVT